MLTEPLPFAHVCGKPRDNFSQRTRYRALLGDLACALKHLFDTKKKKSFFFFFFFFSCNVAQMFPDVELWVVNLETGSNAPTIFSSKTTSGKITNKSWSILAMWKFNFLRDTKCLPNSARLGLDLLNKLNKKLRFKSSCPHSDLWPCFVILHKVCRPVALVLVKWAKLLSIRKYTAG